MVVYYSLGNRKYWFTTIDRLIELAEILSRKSYLLYNVDAIKGTYNDWFILNKDYIRKLIEIIEEVTEEIEDEDILKELLALKQVFDGGDVVFG